MRRVNKGQVPARRQARHFTTLDQVTQLVAARDADPELGFMARLLALCSLPRTNPGDRLRYIRRNGPFTLVVTAGFKTLLPYGTLPRLLLAWVSTEAVPHAIARPQSSAIRSPPSCGIWKSTTMAGRCVVGFKTRCGGCSIRTCSWFTKMPTAKRACIRLWPTGQSFGGTRSGPTIARCGRVRSGSGKNFSTRSSATRSRLDLNILHAVKRSPLGLDLYLWLTYKTFALKRPLRLTWPKLYQQFGADPAKANDARTVDYFRSDCLRELKKIKTAWPDLHARPVTGALLLSPSPPRIPQTKELHGK